MTEGLKENFLLGMNVGGWRRDAAVQVTGENIVMEFTIQYHTSLF